MDVKTAGLMDKEAQEDYLETCLVKIQDAALPDYEKVYWLTGLSYYRHRAAAFAMGFIEGATDAPPSRRHGPRTLTGGARRRRASCSRMPSPTFR
jgi:hypothetical protein